MQLNTRFDTKKPIVDSLIEEADSHGGNLSDSAFSQAISEYGADEEEVMMEMIMAKEYQFSRGPEGWIVSSIL